MSLSPSHPLAADLDHVLSHTRGMWEEMKGQRLFLTGGTGFFGCWLLESFLWANKRLALEASVTVLTRDPGAFARKAPRLADHPALTLLAGDVCSFRFPAGEFPFVVHAATEASATLNSEDPGRMLLTIVEGTARALAFAQGAGTKRFLLTSSGAVYGPQPPNLPAIPEGYPGAPDPLAPGSAYGEGKRAAELLCAAAARRGGPEVAIARCFAFVGPYLPLDIHYAMGNFLRDRLREGQVLVKGDGTPFRSYLYAADLAVWLWTILFKGKNARPYNVGSEKAVSIAETARAVAGSGPYPVPVKLMKEPVPGAPAERYVPDTSRARTELGLAQHIPLPEAVRRTLDWHRLGGEAGR